MLLLTPNVWRLFMTTAFLRSDQTPITHTTYRIKGYKAFTIQDSTPQRNLTETPWAIHIGLTVIEVKAWTLTGRVFSRKTRPAFLFFAEEAADGRLDAFLLRRFVEGVLTAVAAAGVTALTVLHCRNTAVGKEKTERLHFDTTTDQLLNLNNSFTETWLISLIIYQKKKERIMVDCCLFNIYGGEFSTTGKSCAFLS